MPGWYKPVSYTHLGTVERALKVFLEFGLVEILTDGAYYMADIQPVSYTHLDVYKRQEVACIPNFCIK